MKKKIMSLILSAVLVVGAGMPATAYGEDFYSESAETSCGEEENSVVDDDSTENASAEGTDNSWEEDQGNQTDPEAGFVDGGFGDMEEVQGGFEENPVEDAAGEDELWTDEEAEEITDLDASASEFDTARTISTNAIYSTNVMENGEEEWFKFYIPSAGYIALSCKQDFVRDDSSYDYWNAYIYTDGNHEHLATYVLQMKNVLNTRAEFGVSPGYYYLKIGRGPLVITHAKLQFRINYNQSDNWEIEPNNNYSKATLINMNTAYYGGLQKSGDVDWYKIDIPAAGNYELTFAHRYVPDFKPSWRVDIYEDVFSGQGKFLLSSRRNQDTAIGIFQAPSRGTYYIKIYNDFLYDFAIPYSIKLTSHTHSYVTQATSATLYRDGEYTRKCSCGAIGGTGIIYHPSKIALSATTLIYNGHTQVPNVTVYDSKSNVIGPENYKVSYGRNGKSIGKHQLVISFQGKYSGSVTKTYTIKPRGTSIKKLTKLSKGFTVKWSKVSSATGYQIQYSTNKKFKKSSLSTIRKRTATSSKVRSLRGKKKYYVRIRTYKKVGRTTYYSAWSSAKAITTKR